MRVRWRWIALLVLIVSVLSLAVDAVSSQWWWHDRVIVGTQLTFVLLPFALFAFLAVAFMIALASFSRTAGYSDLSRQIIRIKP
jgi:hypothetical protein